MNEVNEKKRKACNDCLHYFACKNTYSDLAEIYTRSDFESAYCQGEDCNDFADKNFFKAFPCAIGDEIFIVVGDNISRYRVVSFSFDSATTWVKAVNEEYADEYKSTTRCLTFDLGWTIFLTERAAENSIAKRRNKTDAEIH